MSRRPTWFLGAPRPDWGAGPWARSGPGCSTTLDSGQADRVWGLIGHWAEARLGECQAQVWPWKGQSSEGKVTGTGLSQL